MMTIMRRIFQIAALCTLLAACQTAGGPNFKPVAAGSGKGVIYVYALGGFGGYGESPVIEVDGKRVGKVQSKGYLAIPVRAGTHKVTVRSVLIGVPFFGKDVSVKVASGRSAYIRVDRKFDSMSYSSSGAVPIYINDVKRVPNKVGRGQIKQTKRSAAG